MSSLAAVNPIDFPQVWDKVDLGGVLSPGWCEWRDWKRHNEWDKKKGKGTRGSTQTLVQQPEASGEFVFHFGYFTLDETPQDQFAQWDAFSSLLQYDPTKKKPQAITIYHPALATLDPPINSVVIEDVGPLEHGGDGQYSVTVKMSEFFPVPPKSNVGTPTTAKQAPPPNTPGTTPIAAEDELQKQIGELLKKAQQP